MAERLCRVGAVAPHRGALRPAAGRSALTMLLTAAGVAAVVIVCVTHRGTLVRGGHVLLGADREWLGPAVVATALIWVAGTVAQLGSIPIRPPIPRLFAVQVAASFANHLLPAGTGGMAVNVRFLERSGMSRGAALRSVGLNSLAGMVSHLLLCAIAVVLAPTILAGVRVRPGAGIVGYVFAGAAVAAVTVVLVARRHRSTRSAAAQAGADAVTWYATARATIVREVNRLREVAADPVRAARLWLGSLAAPLLHGTVLAVLLRAESVAVPVISAMATYLVVSSLAALAPAPGGVGPLDVILVAGFVAVGVPAAAAVGAVLGYRLLTVWVPLLPGACVFAFLAGFRVI